MTDSPYTLITGSRGDEIVTMDEGRVSFISGGGSAEDVIYQAWRAAGGVPNAIDGALSLDALAERAKAAIAARRWEIETAGMLVGGLTVDTDDRTKLLITGARIKADADPDATFDFKASGGWVTLTAAQVIAISDALADQVQALFTAERAHGAAISALVGADDRAGLLAYDIDAGWPS